ncbi:hypothetical protein [Streptomyces sp. DSM 40750]|uniref:hypothetical protein n=1 Tax=Streptomyces sp. DSM 40750 TaxID=2801030 RepID=UPI00214D04F2|nr:hypothetical protein [Streptomyces sp. DSM 40750]UUU23516.1 hypothetical protein JIX55_26440 [Streptomyces sp. DSM 40750]
MALLFGVALLVAVKPSFGVQRLEAAVTRRRRVTALLLAGVGIGFCDGVFGPGVPPS